MTENVRTRSRVPGPVDPGAQGRLPPGASGFHTGADAQQHLARELERQAKVREQGYTPFRYYLKPQEQGHIIILDNNPNRCWFEHALPDPGNQNRRTNYEYCPKEFDACPLCASDKESYYVMIMTVIDLRPFNKRDGTTVRWSRKLLAVKAQQHPYFWRLAEQLGGNLRGACLLMARDSQQSYSIGTPMHVASYSEEQLVQTFQHPAVTGGQDGRVIKEANADLYPFDYDKYFKSQTADDIRRKYGGVAPAGSAAEANSEWGGATPATAAAGALPGQPPATAPVSAPVAALPAPGQPPATPPAPVTAPPVTAPPVTAPPVTAPPPATVAGPAGPVTGGLPGAPAQAAAADPLAALAAAPAAPPPAVAPPTGGPLPGAGTDDGIPF